MLCVNETGWRDTLNWWLKTHLCYLLSSSSWPQHRIGRDVLFHAPNQTTKMIFLLWRRQTGILKICWVKCTQKSGSCTGCKHQKASYAVCICGATLCIPLFNGRVRQDNLKTLISVKYRVSRALRQKLIIHYGRAVFQFVCQFASWRIRGHIASSFQNVLRNCTEANARIECASAYVKQTIV